MGDKLNGQNIVDSIWFADWNIKETNSTNTLNYGELITADSICSKCKIGYDKIKDVIFNPPATIILWKNGTKTVVKVKDDEVYDEEKGLAMAICKKILGKDYHKVFKAYTPDDSGSITDWYDLGYEMGYKLGTLKKVFNGLKDGIDEVTGN